MDSKKNKTLMLDAIVLCAGSSSRFNAKENIEQNEVKGKIKLKSKSLAKILVNLGGKPALAYLLQTLSLSPIVRNCVIVLPADKVPADKVPVDKVVGLKIKELVESYANAHSSYDTRDTHSTSSRWLFAQGGARRQDSLKNGLQLLCKDQSLNNTIASPNNSPTNSPANKNWCMVCDAARPLVSHALLERIATTVARVRDRQSTGDAESKSAKNKPAENNVLGVIPLLPIADSVKRIDKKGFLAESIEREALLLAQTPQAFPPEKLLEWLVQAEQKTPSKIFTDEAQLAIENLAKVAHIQGEARAHKITTQQDIHILEGLLAGEKGAMAVKDIKTEKLTPEKLAPEKSPSEKPFPEFRSCSAFDQHKVCKGETLRLCATDIPCGFALDGHSDADVALHALTDAILALAGSGDIGEHFPPSEQRWRNANSAIFLKHAIEVLNKAGGKLINADITILAEKPNLKEYKLAMRQKLAQLTELECSRIGLKATTLEGLGALGEAKGIAAYASATAKFYS